MPLNLEQWFLPIFTQGNTGTDVFPTYQLTVITVIWDKETRQMWYRSKEISNHMQLVYPKHSQREEFHSQRWRGVIIHIDPQVRPFVQCTTTHGCLVQDVWGWGAQLVSMISTHVTTCRF